MKTVKKVTDYTKQVLNANRALKTEMSTLNGAIRMLKCMLEGKNEFSGVLSNLDAIPYKALKAKVRKSKNGNYSPFYVLQYVYKATKNAEKRELKPTTNKLKPAKKVTAKAA